MQVLGNTILVKPDKAPERTPSGKLIIPRSTKEMLPDWGEIIQAGPMCSIAKVGERVLFPRKSASVIIIDGVDHYLVPEYRIKFIKEK